MLGVKYTEDNKLDCLEINSTGTKNILEACVANKVKKIILHHLQKFMVNPKQTL